MLSVSIPKAILYTDIASTVIDLGEQGYEGLLDPFSLGLITRERETVVSRIVEDIIGSQSSEGIFILDSLISRIFEKEVPSLNALTDDLLGSPHHRAKEMGAKLDQVRSENLFSRLLFEPRNDETIELEAGLTVINTSGLDIPNAYTDVADYSVANKFALVVMSLLTELVARLTSDLPNNKQKAFLIEEAWSVFATRTGRDTLKKSARYARSRNIAIVLVTQVKNDTANNFLSSVGSRLAFREKNKRDAWETLNELGSGSSEPELLMHLDNGECLIRVDGGDTFQLTISE